MIYEVSNSVINDAQRLDRDALFPAEITLASGVVARQVEMPGYFIDFIPGGRRLVVTFESASARRMRPNGARDSWGQKFLVGQNCSTIAVKPKRVDWYRGRDLHAFFRSAALARFCGRFERVMFYGSSMGGYAALTFSQALPGSIVLAHVPQSTLAPDLVPWERRFVEARREDWSGDFRDAADGSAAASAIYVTYDPLYAPDARHVARLRGGNLIPLKVPAASHRVPDTLSRLGLIKTVFLRAMALDKDFFPPLIRSRRNLASYYMGLRRHARDPATADACLKRATQIDADDVSLKIELFNEAFSENRYSDCTAIFEQLGKLPKLSNSTRLLVVARAARSYIERDRLAEAASLAKTVVNARTENIRYYKTMTGVLRDLGDAEAASTMADRTLMLEQLRRAAVG